MTKGRQANWKCVGNELNLGKIGNHHGFSNGKSVAITVYKAIEKRNILMKSEKIAKMIDCLCDDLKSLCIRRDQLFQELNDMQVPVQQFKQFDRYFISEKVRSLSKQKTSASKEVTVSSKQKPRKKLKGDKRKATEQLKVKPFPKPFGEKLISDIVKEIDRGTDKFEFEDQSRLHKLYQPARMRYQEHISSAESTGAATAYPQLPSIAECQTLLKEAKEIEETLKITEHPQSIVQESEGSIVP